jgi:hypothetical protein
MKSGKASVNQKRKTASRGSKPAEYHPFIKAVAAIAAVFIFFQLLPHTGDIRRQGLSKMNSFSKALFSAIPSWIGLWTVDMPKGQFHPFFPSAEEIRKEARIVEPIIDLLKEKRFFRTFKVDLNKECPFWARQNLCSSPSGSCSVCECTEDEIPLPWKMKPVEHFVDRGFYEREELTPWIDSGFKGLEGPAGVAEADFLRGLAGTDEGGQSTYVDLSLNPPGLRTIKAEISGA